MRFSILVSLSKTLQKSAVPTGLLGMGHKEQQTACRETKTPPKRGLDG